MRGAVRHRWLLTAAVFGGIVWAPYQVGATLWILDMDENASFSCSLDKPKAALTALVAVGLEVAFALGWIALGGLDAFSCAGAI